MNTYVLVNKHMNDIPATQHIVSAAAVILPTASFWVRASPIITDVAGVCGIAWYIYLGIRELNKWRLNQQWPKNHL